MKRMQTIETHDMPTAWLAAAKAGDPQVGPDVSAPLRLVGRGKGWGAALSQVGSPIALGAHGQKCRFPFLFSPFPPTPHPTPQGGGEPVASVPATGRRRLASGPSLASSLAFAALVPAPAFAQGTETSQSLFTPTVIGVAIAGLVLGGVVGFIRRRKEMKK